MGATPRFVWYPSNDRVRYTQLTQPVTDVTEFPIRVEQVSDTMEGARVSVQTLGYRGVSIRSEKITSLADVRELEALTNHLANRHVVAFQEDDLANFGTWAAILPPSGTTGIITLGPKFSSFGPAFPVAGDVHVLIGRSPNGCYIREEAVVSTWDGTTITYDEAIINDFSAGDFCFIKDKRFFPWLRLRRDALSRPMLSHDGRITWTLDLALEEVPQMVGTIGGAGGFLDVEVSPTGTQSFDGGGGYGGIG